MEDFKYKLSIIIPMYNCEKYIADCLDSILESDLPKEDYEVIIINDGSKDHCPQIAQDYVSKYGHFTFLTQENQGQSVARNYGLEIAKGEYVWFVDADDKVDSKVGIHVYTDLLRHWGLDILAFQLRRITEKEVFISYECEQPTVKKNVVVKGRDAILSGYLPSSVCALFIKKELMINKNLFFKPGITQQDVELTYKLFAHANDVFFSELKPYLYIHHEESTSKSKTAEKRTKYECDKVEIIKSFHGLAESFKSKDSELSNHIKQYANCALFGCVYNLYRHRKEWQPMGINIAVLTKLKEEGLYPMKGPFGSWKKKLFASILNFEFLLT